MVKPPKFLIFRIYYKDSVYYNGIERKLKGIGGHSR